jgi:ribosome biogenesis protein NSA1
MRFITGDDVGLLKISTFVNVAPKPNKKPRTTSTKLPPKPVAKTTVYGNINRQRAISLIANHTNQSVVVARANGEVEIICLNTGDVLGSWQLFTHQLDRNGSPLLNKHRKPEHFIGLHSSNGLIITCTDTGVVTYIHSSPDIAIPETTVSLDQDLLCVMRVHPSHPHIFATGGDERPLTIWDITTSPACTGDALPVLTTTWISKNVSNDFLDMRVPVWVTDIKWTSDDATKLMASSGHMHVRTYTTAQRKPLTSFKVGEHPIKSIVLSKDGYE